MDKDDINDLFSELDEDDEDSAVKTDRRIMFMGRVPFDSRKDEEYNYNVLIGNLERASIPPWEYLPEHLSNLEFNARTFRCVVGGFRERIKCFKVTSENAEKIRIELVDDTTDKLKVSVSENFLGKPHFVFRWEGQDIFGEMV